MRTRLSHPSLAIVRRSRRELGHAHTEPAPELDPAVSRARHAGGPHDQASYSCECGCVFLAPVSTTVACPHCAARQPW
jgi:hypothetical protein